MREILFRGKRIDNYVKDSSVDYAEKGVGEWVYGDIIHRRYYKNRDVIVIRTEDSGFDNYSDYEVDPETLGQYTGLSDKNGKKIFEGDIVRTHYANAPKAVFVETVIFDGGKFCATSTNEGCITTTTLWDGVPILAIDKSVYMDEVEVIGNIHDNPDLLGGDDE